jgi:hypothetical protein
MIGSLLLGQAQSQGGSLAQSETHDSIFAKFCDGVHEDSAIPWQERIRDLVDYNYNTEKYPKFSFDPLTEKDLLGLLKELLPVATSFTATAQELGFEPLIQAILRQYADIEVEDKETVKPTEDQITPTKEEIETVQPEDHNSIITDVMGNIPVKG